MIRYSSIIKKQKLLVAQLVGQPVRSSRSICCLDGDVRPRRRNPPSFDDFAYAWTQHVRRLRTGFRGLAAPAIRTSEFCGVEVKSHLPILKLSWYAEPTRKHSSPPSIQNCEMKTHLPARWPKNPLRCPAVRALCTTRTKPSNDRAIKVS